VATFIATSSKGAVVAFLLRYLAAGTQHSRALFLLFSIIAVASMFAGNLLALGQNNVKRVLAFSSIAHFGYILAVFLAGHSTDAWRRSLSGGVYGDPSNGFRHRHLPLDFGR